jgi:hypothetical protein
MMKRYYLLFWFLTFIVPVCIASTDDVTMVSYEQGWFDSGGTIALKNITGEFKITDYLSRDFWHGESEGSNSLFDGFWLFALLAAFLCISIAVGLYVLVAVMAQQRHRNVVVWILLSMLVSPLVMVIVLLCIGDSQKDQD